MADNTEAQASLHPALESADARTVIDLAKANGARGWKVNGAGGEGGSMTLLCGRSASQRRELARAITAANPLFQVVPTYLSRFGLRIWET
jgi:D-glycero-alpha-D-manno-heptose-7-phosphate kinase